MNDTEDSAVAKQTPLLWKDIWWIKATVLILTSAACYFSLNALAKICRFLKPNKNKTNNLENDIDSSHATSSTLPKTSTGCNGNNNATTPRQARLESSSLIDTLEFSSTRRMKTFQRNEDDMEFYDLDHHGIRFYDNNGSSSSSLRRFPRSVSTVVEASLVTSGVRHRQRPGPTVVNMPAFPKIDARARAFNEGSMEAGKKSERNVDGHGCSSGSMGYSAQLNFSRLSTVAEEDAQDLARVPTPSPSLVTDKCSKDPSLCTNLECSICRNKIFYVCKSCVCSKQKTKKELTRSINYDDEDTDCESDYCPEIQPEFIDDNFEDMESINMTSDEATDSKS